MKYYEIQEQEARFRSILSGHDVKEDVIDSLIEDDIYLQFAYNRNKEVKMSPQYNPDPTQVSAFFYMFEKGDYLFQVGEGKPFEGMNQKGDSNAGIRYPMICSDVLDGGDPKAKGKKQMFTCYIHSEGAVSFSKRFLMACLGYDATSEGELKFDEEKRGMDWGIDPNPEAPSVGEMWRAVQGSTLICHCSTKLNDEGQKQQQWNGFSPLSDA